MEIYKKMKIIHYPSLRTMLMVEKVLREAEVVIDREEIKRRLPVKIMHQTLNLVLAYLEEKGMIIDGHKGVLWIYNSSQKLRKAIENAKEISINQKLNAKQKNIKVKGEINKIAKIILGILMKFNVARAGIFGSYARGEQNKKSDIDILVEFKGERSLFDLVELEMLLRKALNKKVDLLTYNSINPLLKKRILNEEVRIL